MLGRTLRLGKRFAPMMAMQMQNASRGYVADAFVPGGGLLMRAASGLHNAWEYLTARREWQKRVFMRRVNLSLCCIRTIPADGPQPQIQWPGHAGHTDHAQTARVPSPDDMYSLHIRTLLEKDISDVFLRNRALVGHVLDEAAKTKELTPFLSLPADDSWYMLTAILNEISAVFAHGHMLAAHGLAKDEPYWFGMTREAYTQNKSPRFEKLRILLIHDDALRNFESYSQDKRITRGLFGDRWRTLDAMHAIYKDHLRSEAEFKDRLLPVHFRHKIMRVSLPIPIAGAHSPFPLMI